MLSVLRLFFFYFNGNLRDLHSFPTRRSSDLVVIIFSGPAKRAVLQNMHEIQDIIRQFTGARLSAVERHVDIPGDRKSTRLNSSHVKISYAVFCLKKKNIT